MTDENEDVVRREIDLPACRETVWTVVGDPAELGSWLADEARLDAVEPGAQGVVLTEGELREVVIDEVVPGRRVALRWSALPDGPERLVELTLDDTEDGGTHLVVIELPLTLVEAVGAGFARTLADHAGPQMTAVAG